MNPLTSLDMTAIAAEWQRAVMPSVYARLTAVELRSQLSILAQDVIALLVAEEYDSSAVQEQGRRLAALGLLEGAMLGQSLNILSRAWQPLLETDYATAVLQRSPVLTGDLAHGFFDQSVEIVLDQQETIRRAQLQTLGRLHQQLEQQRDQLQQANALLQTSIRERTEIAAQLEIREEQFRSLFEHSPVALWLVDGTAAVLALRALHQRGVSNLRRHFEEHPAELLAIARSIVDLAMNQQAAALVERIRETTLRYGHPALARTSTSTLMEELLEALADGRDHQSGPCQLLTNEGEILETLYYWSIIETGDSADVHMIVSLVDITAQKKAEEELRLAGERLQTLNDLQTAVLAAESTQAIAAAALQHVAEIVPVKTANVSLINKQVTHTILLASTDSEQLPGKETPMVDMALLERLRRNEILLIPNLAQHEPENANLKALAESGGRSLLTVPLLAHGLLVGFLTLLSAGTHAFGPQEVAITREIGASVAIALYNATLLETEQKARTEAETMRAVAARLGSSLNQDEVLEVVLTQLGAVLPFDGASIMLVEEERLRLAAARGRGLAPLGARAYLLHELPNLRRLMSDHTPQLIGDTVQDPEWTVMPGREYIRCAIAVPLLGGGTLQGILSVDHAQPYFYDEHALNVAQAFAAQAGIALANARLYQQVQTSAEGLRDHVAQRTRELNALYDIAAVTSRHLDLQVLLDEALDLTLREFDCAAGAVLTLDDSGERLLLLAERQLPAAQQGLLDDVAVKDLHLPALQSIEAPIIVPDTNDPQQAPGPALAKLGRCFAAVPLRARGLALGLLVLLSDEVHVLDEQETRLLGSLADHIGIAMENARLRRESELLAVLHERERLAQDLHDSATQSLYSLTLFSAAARAQLRARNWETAEHYLTEVDNTADQAHREVRLLLHELNVGEARQPDLVQALYRRLRAVEGRSGITARLNAPDRVILPEKMELELYRVASEALTNALKHAQAQHVQIDIAQEDGRVEMTVSDDGRGFDMAEAAKGSGMGLSSIRQRVQSLDGACEIESRPGQGTRVRVTVPVVAR